MPIISSSFGTKNPRYHHSFRACRIHVTHSRYLPCQSQWVDHATDWRLEQRPNSDNLDVLWHILADADDAHASTISSIATLDYVDLRHNERRNRDTQQWRRMISKFRYMEAPPTDWKNPTTIQLASDQAIEARHCHNISIRRQMISVTTEQYTYRWRSHQTEPRFTMFSKQSSSMLSKTAGGRYINISLSIEMFASRPKPSSAP